MTTITECTELLECNYESIAHVMHELTDHIWDALHNVADLARLEELADATGNIGPRSKPTPVSLHNYTMWELGLDVLANFEPDAAQDARRATHALEDALRVQAKARAVQGVSS